MVSGKSKRLSPTQLRALIKVGALKKSAEKDAKAELKKMNRRKTGKRKKSFSR